MKHLKNADANLRRTCQILILMIWFIIKNHLINLHVSWDEVPEKLRGNIWTDWYFRSRACLPSGAAAQYESEVVYNMKEEFQKLESFYRYRFGFEEYPNLFKQYFAKLVHSTDNKLAALNSAVWSGGTFIYVPKGVKVDVRFADLLPD